MTRALPFQREAMGLMRWTTSRERGDQEAQITPMVVPRDRSPSLSRSPPRHERLTPSAPARRARPATLRKLRRTSVKARRFVFMGNPRGMSVGAGNAAMFEADEDAVPQTV